MKDVVEFQDVEPSTDTLDVVIRLSNRCNFSCNYCPYYDNTERFYDIDHMKGLFEGILNETSDRKVMFYLHGGEPTIVPHLQQILSDILSQYSDRDITFEIQTNTSQHIKWFEKLKHLKNNIKFICSYQHHQNKSFEKWLAKVKFLHNTGLLHQIDFMLEEDDVDTIKSHLRTIKSDKALSNVTTLHYINYEVNDEYSDVIDMFKRDDLNMYKVKYRDGRTEIVEKNTVHERGLDSFKLFRCAAGRNNLVVDVNGDVWYCLGHKGFGNNINKDTPACNVFTNNKIKKMTSKDCICLWSKCLCELWLKKWRP